MDEKFIPALKITFYGTWPTRILTCFYFIPEIGFSYDHTRPKVPARTRPKIPAQFARKYADLQITVLTRTYFYRRHNIHTTTQAQFQTKICKSLRGKHNSFIFLVIF